MKKIIALLIMFSLNSFAQENKEDKTNRQMLSFIKEQEVSMPAVRDYLVGRLETIKKETKDTVLITDCDTYISDLNSIKFETKRGSIKNVTQEDLKEFYTNDDKFNNIYTISSKKNKSWFRISSFIRVLGNDVYLILNTKYQGKGWLFIQSVTILTPEEKLNYIVPKGSREVTTSAYVIEEMNNIANNELYETMKKIANSTTELDVRFNGSKQDYDFKLTLKEIADIKTTLNLYHKLLDK